MTGAVQSSEAFKQLNRMKIAQSPPDSAVSESGGYFVSEAFFNRFLHFLDKISKEFALYFPILSFFYLYKKRDCDIL